MADRTDRPEETRVAEDICRRIPDSATEAEVAAILRHSDLVERGIVSMSERRHSRLLNTTVRRSFIVGAGAFGVLVAVIFAVRAGLTGIVSAVQATTSVPLVGIPIPLWTVVVGIGSGLVLSFRVPASDGPELDGEMSLVPYEPSGIDWEQVALELDVRLAPTVTTGRVLSKTTQRHVLVIGLLFGAVSVVAGVVTAGVAASSGTTALFGALSVFVVGIASVGIELPAPRFPDGSTAALRWLFVTDTGVVGTVLETNDQYKRAAATGVFCGVVFGVGVGFGAATLIAIFGVSGGVGVLLGISLLPLASMRLAGAERTSV